MVDGVRASGLETVCCASAEQGRQHLFASGLSLVVVGEVLADAMGADLVSELRRAGRDTAAIVIASREVDAPQAARFRTLGVAALVEGPVTDEALVQVIVGVLEERRRAAWSAPERSDVARALAALRAEFAVLLPGRITEVVDALERARASSDAEGDARALVHKLAGTAGSYGWGALSRALAEIEAELRVAGRPRDWARIDDALDVALGAGSDPD